MDAREEAAVEEVPGEECSARIVVRWAMHELAVMIGQNAVWFSGRCLRE